MRDKQYQWQRQPESYRDLTETQGAASAIKLETGGGLTAKSTNHKYAFHV